MDQKESQLIDRLSALKPRRDFYDHYYISLKNKYSFHTVGKAANSTVKRILYEFELEGTHYPMPSVHMRQQSPFVSPYQIDDEALSSVLTSEEYYRFTFVREPYSRLLSCFLDRIADQRSRPYKELMRHMKRPLGYSPTFGEFIEAVCDQSDRQQNNHWRLQYADCLCSIIQYDFVGKQESFLADMAQVYREVSGRELPEAAAEINASPAVTSASSQGDIYWNLSLQNMVSARYHDDFEFFKYRKKG